MNAFSFVRLIALLRKESIQILRDAMTLRIIIMIPIMQLFLFGYAINSDPKHLPAGLLSIEDSKYTRTIAAALNNSGYYNIRVIRVGSGSGGGTRARRADVRHRVSAGFRPRRRPRRDSPAC